MRCRVGPKGTAALAAFLMVGFASFMEAVLSAPSLTATPVSTSQVNLTWTDPNPNETGYQLERSLASTTGFAIITTVGKNGTTFSNTGLAAGTTYYYRVKATSNNGGSAYSAVKSARTLGGAIPTPTPPPPSGVPVAPSNLAAGAASSTQINLSWMDRSTNETAFKVERATASAGPWAQIGTTAGTSYASAGLAPSTTYYYRVRAYNAYGNSAYTNTALAATSAGAAGPAIPTGLAATAASASQINLTWNDTASNETGFKVERSTAATGWAQIGTTAVNVRTFSSTGLSAGTAYSYRVRAYNTSGDSGYSNTASATTGSAGGARWSRRFGDTTDDRTRSVAVDGSGNLAVTGYYDGITDFGGGLITSYSGGQGPTKDIFVARYSSTGAHSWSRAIGGTGSEEGASVAVDGSGNVLVTGQQGSFQVDFGGGTQFTHGGTDIFVAKYSPTGGFVWGKTLGGAGYEGGNGIAADAGGNVIVTGGIDPGGVSLGGGVLASAGYQDIFVAKYSAAGAHVWSKRFGGALSDAGVAVDTDALGNIYVTGNFEGSVSFGGGSLSSSGGKDVFVVKFDPSGNHVWSKKFGGASNDFAGGLAVDASGDVAISGRFAGSVNFGGGSLTSAGGEDAYLVKLSGASGNHAWSKRFGGASNDLAAAVAADGSGNIAVTGHYNGLVDFGGGALQSLSFDVFAAKYDSAGAHLWSRRYGDSNYQFGTAVAAAANGDVVLGGYFNYNVDFGTGILTSAGESTYDGLLTSIGP